MTEEIKIVGVDKSRTHNPDPSKLLYDVYFTLSAEPGDVWIQAFEASRHLPRHTGWRRARVEASGVVVHCTLDEVQGQLDDLKIDVASANAAAAKAFATHEAQRIERKRQEEEESRLKGRLLDDLNFD